MNRVPPFLGPLGIFEFPTQAPAGAAPEATGETAGLPAQATPPAEAARNSTSEPGGPSIGTRADFRLVDLPPAWVLVLVVAPLVFAVCLAGYGRERLSLRSRLVLALLRMAAIVTLLVVIFRPVEVERREDVQLAEVLVLLDDSASMRRKDPYNGDAASQRAAEKLAGKPAADSMRLELEQALLSREILPRLAEQDYVPRVFRFAEALTPYNLESSETPAGAPAADPNAPAGNSPGATARDALAGHGATTQIGDALAGVLAAHHGRHVTDVLVISDGRSNAGLSPVDAARAASSAGIPVHTLLLGDARREKNALIEIIEVPTTALEGDEIAVVVRVVGRGLEVDQPTSVQLEELQGGTASVAAEEQVQLRETGERATLLARAAAADPRTGERRFRVSIPPLEGETLLDDNALEFSVHVTPAKVRVLYVDGYPRWEYGRLKELLKRADEKLEVQCMLMSASPDFPQETTRGLTPLQRVPTDRKALLENYDVVILGDVNPYTISPDPAQADEFMKSLREFVERGGGLMFMAGEHDNPRSFLRTPLEELLPVAVDASDENALSIPRQAWQPRLEDPLVPHEIVRLFPDPDINRKLWESPEGLSGMYWFAPVSRAKPGTQVLLRHPTLENSAGRYPLLVAGYFPSGRTLFVGFDETWRWCFHYGDTHHERFWRNAIRWLALGRLKSGDRRFRVEVARTSYTLGERAAIEARVLDEDFRPSAQPKQDVVASDPEGRESRLELPAVPGRAGVFRATLDADRLGAWRVWIEGAGTRLASADFEVVLPSLENQDPSPDPGTLRELSALTGGKAVMLSDFQALFAQFPGGEERREPISSRLDDVWDRWTTLWIALALLAAEWILRKRWELV
ncbi:MAG: hypothetical protein IPK67_17850 [Planctomycetes bacterium]|nr:hypothetical protein [Planctomycetota bacterium]